MIPQKTIIFQCSWSLSVTNKIVPRTCVACNRRYATRTSFLESFKKMAFLFFTFQLNIENITILHTFALFLPCSWDLFALQKNFYEHLRAPIESTHIGNHLVKVFKKLRFCFSQCRWPKTR